MLIRGDLLFGYRPGRNDTKFRTGSGHADPNLRNLQPGRGVRHYALEPIAVDDGILHAMVTFKSETMGRVRMPSRPLFAARSRSHCRTAIWRNIKTNMIIED